MLVQAKSGHQAEDEQINAFLLVLVIAGGLLGFGSGAIAQMQQNLLCTVTKKADGQNDSSREQLERGRFAVRLRHASEKVIVERCSFARSQNRVTCDPYVVDQVSYDPAIGAAKYYLFRSQFDVQVFNNLSFVENNGRGGIAWGQCAVEQSKKGGLFRASKRCSSRPLSPLFASALGLGGLFSYRRKRKGAMVTT